MVLEPTHVPQVVKRERRTDLVICALLVLAAGVVFSKDLTVGGVRWPDESTHVMDGVLILDWLRAGPAAWKNPVAFAIQQYGHYPNLGIVGVYPPGFAAVEAAFLAVLGVSVVTGRIAVVCFGIAATIGCYVLARRWNTRWTAICTTALLIGMPMTITWTRQTMLEMPTLAVLVWLLCFAQRYADEPTWRRLLPVAALAVAAPLFKQYAVFMIPVLGVAALHLWRRRRIPLRHLVVTATFVGIVLGGYAFFSVLERGQGPLLTRAFNASTPVAQWLSWPELSFYGRSLLSDQGAGPVIAALAALGLALSLRRRDGRWMLLLLWFVAAYGIVAVMQHKEPRFLFFAYLPVAFWAGLAAATLLERLPARRFRATAGVAAVAVVLACGYRTPIDYRPDFAPLATAYAAQLRGGLVLVEADRDTSFVLAARGSAGPRGCTVIRGSKTLYACASDVNWDFRSYVSSPEDVAALLDRFAFDLLFVERGNVRGLREVTLLQQEVGDLDRYELLGSHALRVPPPHEARPVVIDVYRPRHVGPRLAREIDIPMPLVGRTVRVTIGGPQ